MKHVFCILAYKELDQLYKLIKKLEPYGAIIVHLDKGKEYPEEKLARLFETNAQFISRYSLYWGSTNTVRTIARLIQYANDSMYANFWCHVLTETSYPLMDKESFNKYFSELYMSGYLSMIHFDNKVSREYYLNRLLINNYSDYINEHKLSEKVLGEIDSLHRHQIYLIKKHNVILKKVPGDFHHAGSTWFSITGLEIANLLDYIEEHESFFLENTFLSEEHIFAYFADKFATSNYNELTHYISWEKGAKSPRYLDESDYESVKNCGLPFMRKINESSNKLLSLLGI